MSKPVAPADLPAEERPKFGSKVSAEYPNKAGWTAVEPPLGLHPSTQLPAPAEERETPVEPEPAVCTQCGRQVFWNALAHRICVEDGQVKVLACLAALPAEDRAVRAPQEPGVREAGESCGTCQHFVDHADASEPDDDDDIQKCAHLIDTLGFAKAIEIDPYGGPWTHRHGWCRHWEPGPSLWQREEAVSDDAVDPAGWSSHRLTTRA
jgi:hypothetical protein